MIAQCRVHQLDLPFRLRMTHASASRVSSDSIIVEIEADSVRGYGEAVLRDYVGGLPPGASPLEAASAALAPVVRALRGAGWDEARCMLARCQAPAQLRPLLGALEAALMDAACASRGVDVFNLLGMEPVRDTIRYSAVLPIVSLQVAGPFLELIASWRVPSVRIKLGKEAEYNDSILAKARRLLSPSTVLRVDVNQVWDAANLAAHLEVCRRHGVRFVEDPAPESALQDRGGAPDFVFVADETLVTEADLDKIAAGGVYGAVNIRLSKNGGLFRSLEMARRAAGAGLRVCLGCHVGETGILSSIGRSTAALVEAPEFVDGSYDSVLLSDNITRESCDFGDGGLAPVVRGAGVGYSVDPEKLRRYATRTIDLTLS
jgi:L-Ala-D/L-Glu epimerase